MSLPAIFAMVLASFVALPPQLSIARSAAPIRHISGKPLLQHSARVMDKINQVHAEGLVVETHGRLKSRLQISGDCDASKASDRSGSTLDVRARSWLHGYIPTGKAMKYYSAHFVIAGTNSSTPPRSWERSTLTGNKWERRPFVQSGIVSQVQEMCSSLLMGQFLSPTNNATTRFRDLGPSFVGKGPVQGLGMTASKPGAMFRDEWYIDPSSFQLLRLFESVADATSGQSWTFTYSRFNVKVSIQIPRST
jgi:hypothetical protein